MSVLAGEDADSDDGSEEESSEDDSDEDDSDESEEDSEIEDEEDKFAEMEEFGDGNTQSVTAATIAANKPNEDRFFMDTKQRLFGVFDGHGGRHCSQFTVEHISETFAKFNSGPKDTKADLDDLEDAFFSSSDKSEKQDKGKGKGDGATGVKAALKKTFQALDDEFFSALGEEHNICGTCGLLCVVEDRCVWAANAGDSRAVVVEHRDRGAIHGVPLTEDLNTSCAKECTKVAARSSDAQAVRYNERDLIGKSTGSAMKRVAGSLMVTRALGDGYLKRKELSMHPFEEHVPYITAKPKVTRMDLDKRHSYLVIATDGVWDHLR